MCCDSLSRDHSVALSLRNLFGAIARLWRFHSSRHTILSSEDAKRSAPRMSRALCKATSLARRRFRTFLYSVLLVIMM